MDIHTLYIIAYATSTTSCLGSCAILLFLNYGNIETNPVYLKARRILAFATFLVAIGLLVSLTTRKWQPVGWDIASFPVTLIASSQTLLFTFSLILLFNEQYATRQRILLHATPSLLFTLAYAGACLIWKDHPVYAYSEWKSLVTNPPSLIRTLYLACLHHPVRHLCKTIPARTTYLPLPLGRSEDRRQVAQTRTGDKRVLPCLRHRPLYAEPRLESSPASRNHRDLPIHRFLFRLRNLLRKLQFHLSGCPNPHP
ncbi:MAG: hypothetical protein ACLRS8_17150 [Parabacteroides merdae]